MVSLIVAGVACLGIPIGMSRVWSQGEFRAFVFLALLVAVASVALGVAGIMKTERRVPAGIAIAVGTILSLIYGVIFWLSTPF